MRSLMTLFPLRALCRRSRWTAVRAAVVVVAVWWVGQGTGAQNPCDHFPHTRDGNIQQGICYAQLNHVSGSREQIDRTCEGFIHCGGFNDLGDCHLAHNICKGIAAAAATRCDRTGFDLFEGPFFQNAACRAVQRRCAEGTADDQEMCRQVDRLMFAATHAMPPTLSAEQVRALRQPIGPRPGAYQIVAVEASMCVEASHAPGPGFMPGVTTRLIHLELQSCTPPGGGSWPLVFVVPHPAGGFTLRYGPSISGRCVTVGRNVVIGPPAADLVLCEAEDRACAVGARDQRFTFQHAGANPDDWYVVSDQPGFSASGIQVLDVRGSGRTRGTEIVLFEQGNRPNQQFRFTRRGDLPQDLTLCATQLGWHQAPDGPVWSIPVPNVNLPGGDYGPTLTGLDAEGCALACVRDTRCRAYSAQQSSLDRNSFTCQLKSSPGTPTYGPNVWSGIVR